MGTEIPESLKKYSIISSKNIWQPIATLTNYQIGQHKSTKQFGDIYRVPLVGDLEEEVSIYQFRKDYGEFLVEVREVVIEDGGGFCGESCCLVVVTERIEVRLSDIEDVPFNEGLYLLKVALRGAIKISEKYGIVKYTPAMVCINSQRRCKLWMNEDLANNRKNFTKNINQEEEAIQLMKIIESRMYGFEMKEYYLNKQQFRPNDVQTSLYFIEKMIEMSGKKIDKIQTDYNQIKKNQLEEEHNILEKSYKRKNDKEDNSTNMEKSKMSQSKYTYMSSSKKSALPPLPGKKKEQTLDKQKEDKQKEENTFTESFKIKKKGISNIIKNKVIKRQQKAFSDKSEEESQIKAQGEAEKATKKIGMKPFIRFNKPSPTE